MFACCIQFHTHCIHAAFNSHGKAFSQSFLIYIVLVLAYPNGLGFNFDQFGQMVKQDHECRDTTERLNRLDAGQHSQSLESYYAHVPGLKVLMRTGVSPSSRPSL